MADLWESTVYQSAVEQEHRDLHHQLSHDDYRQMKTAVEANSDAWSSTSSAQPVGGMPPRVIQTMNGIPDAKATRARKDAPLIKLSSGLLNTYLSINEKYYASLKKRNAAKEAAEASAASAGKKDEKDVPYQYKPSADSSLYDDKNCDYIIRVGETWDNRYEVLKVLGRGSFGQVVEAYDSVSKEHVAIKIIKNKQAFYNQALLEIRILQYLNANDKKDQSHIVRMKRHFEWRNHLCISYELLSMNLYELLRNQNFAGVSLNLVRKFAVQILTALRFLSRSDINIIHCDLKPENIVLKNSKRSALKLIDFGSSCFSNQKTYSYIQSRFYRSPEVLLGVPYQTSIDMWSLGCLLVEMHTGQPLFDGLTEHEQICKLADVLGQPPAEMFGRACLKKRNVMYRQHASGAYSILPCKSFVPKHKDLTEVVKDKMHSIAAATPGSGGHVSAAVEADYDSFLDLIRQMLKYNPEERIRPEEALEHPWLHAVSPALEKKVYAGQPVSSLGLLSSASSTSSAAYMPYASASQQEPERVAAQPLMKRVERFTTGLSWARKRMY